MVPKKIREEYEKLKEEIEYHNYRYYVLADPIISDAEYDKLFKRLVEIEKKYPELVSPDSPTQRVGGKVLEYFEKVKHTIPMMSLDNTYDEKEIMEFDKRVKKLIGTDNVEYVCELKIDGVSISLRYENGILKQAITRGDGITGDDVTENIKTVKSIPLRLREKLTIEVRGEIYMPSKEFERLNREREEQGLNVFANPRNATAGTLKLLDTSEVAKRHLDSFIYYIINPENFNIKTQWEALEFLRKIGFKVNPNNYLAKNIQEVIDYWKEWTEKKKELDYGADGVVVKVNSFEYQKILGETSRSPRWAIAFKFPAEQVTTKLINVVFQVGSTGIITPVAEFEPVFLEGTTVKRASLHNFDYIKDRDIRIGDFVVIEKAGGIIPQVVQVLKEKRTGEEKEITPPEKCPVCGGPVGKLNPEEVAIRCLNPFCKAKLKRNLELWASRDAMDIGGLGPKLIDRIVESKLIEDIADLYFLTPFDLATLGAGVKHKTIMNLLKQIEESKNRGLDRVLYGLGIPKVGKKLAKELAMKFGSIDKLMNAKLYELTSMEGIGEDIAESIIEFFSYEHTKKVIEKLKKAGVKLEATIKKTEGPLKGLTVCVTGELKGMSRSDFAKLIEEHGGTFTNNLTKKTHILVVGENPGSKLEKAKKLGIEVMKEEEFFKKFKLNLSEKRKNNKLSLF